MKARLIFAIVVVVFAYLFYTAYTKFDLFKTYELKNESLCSKYPITFPVEDYVEFGGFLIGGVSDKVSLYIDSTKGPAVTANGWLVLVKPEPFSWANLTIENWPEDVAFQPLGMSLYQSSTLLVVNLGYARGGTRIEVLKLSLNDNKVVVTYQRSVKFDESFEGIVNSVVQFKDDEYFITTWHPFPDSKTGRAHSVWSKISRVFYWLFFRSTFIFRCSDVQGNAQCVKLYAGHIMNGLAAFNGNLFAADTGLKQVLEFRINRDGSLKLESTISLNFSPDNISTGPDKVYATGAIVTLESAKRLGGGSNPVATTIAQLQKNGKDWEVTELYSQSVISGASVAVPDGDLFVLGSWHDNHIGVCKKPN